MYGISETHHDLDELVFLDVAKTLKFGEIIISGLCDWHWPLWVTPIDLIISANSASVRYSPSFAIYLRISWAEIIPSLSISKMSKASVSSSLASDSFNFCAMKSRNSSKLMTPSFAESASWIKSVSSFSVGFCPSLYRRLPSWALLMLLPVPTTKLKASLYCLAVS